jgi:hypothetical protein
VSRTKTAARGRRVRDYLRAPLTVGEPDVIGPLAVYPVFGPTASQPLVAAAACDGALVVQEQPSASVRDLVVTNKSDVPVLLYEGEELLGGQQNRSVDVAVLVGAGATLTVAVSCVEAGRWDASRKHKRFVSAPHSPSPDLRLKKWAAARRAELGGRRAAADQGECWDEIDSISRQLGTRSRTAALSDVFNQRHQDLAHFEQACALHDGQLGALVMIGGRFAVLDLVGRPDVFAALHGQLVRGYALDALVCETGADAPVLPTHRVEELLAAAVDTAAEEHPTPGLGTRLRLAAAAAGSALVHDGELIQLTAFPGNGDADAQSGPPAKRARGIARPSRRRR